MTESAHRLPQLRSRSRQATEALIDTPSMELFFELLAAFPSARVILTAREPQRWAESRRARHPSDRPPILHMLGAPFEQIAVGALSAQQGATLLALWQRLVLGSVPPERLLVLDVFTMASDELWRRLCVFLRRPLPLREDGTLPPFPHLSYGEDMR